MFLQPIEFLLPVHCPGPSHAESSVAHLANGSLILISLHPSSKVVGMDERCAQAQWSNECVAPSRVRMSTITDSGRRLPPLHHVYGIDQSVNLEAPAATNATKAPLHIDELAGLLALIRHH